MTKHKHYETILAWAEGKEIEFKMQDSGIWCEASSPNWDKNIEFRVKPEAKRLAVYENRNGGYVLNKVRFENEDVFTFVGFITLSD